MKMKLFTFLSILLPILSWSQYEIKKKTYQKEIFFTGILTSKKFKRLVVIILIN